MRIILNSSPFSNAAADSHNEVTVLTLGTLPNQIYTSVRNQNKHEVVK